MPEIAQKVMDWFAMLRLIISEVEKQAGARPSPRLASNVRLSLGDDTLPLGADQQEQRLAEVGRTLLRELSDHDIFVCDPENTEIATHSADTGLADVLLSLTWNVPIKEETLNHIRHSLAHLESFGSQTSSYAKEMRAKLP